MIYEYGFKQWGEERADTYYDALIDHLHQLCDNAPPCLLKAYASLHQLQLEAAPDGLGGAGQG